MKARDVTATVEDLEHLDEARVGAEEAAGRTGFASAEAMEKWLARHDAYDLWLAFKRRDAPGLHSAEQRREQAAAKQVDRIIEVLDAADQSGRAATRRKAEKARGLIAELRATVAAEKADDERKAEARKEIERLERELAKAKSRLKGSTTLTVASSVSAAELREWARRNGIQCPAKGRVPAAVAEAYEAEEKAS